VDLNIIGKHELFYVSNVKKRVRCFNLVTCRYFLSFPSSAELGLNILALFLLHIIKKKEYLNVTMYLGNLIQLFNVFFYAKLNFVFFISVKHVCSRKCLNNINDDPEKLKGNNPLLIPLFYGWER
jgi:hypothetical protein